MCLLYSSGLFTVFGLAIFHVKHHYEVYYCQSLYPIPKGACDQRTLSILWAVPVAWVGVVICSAASVLWLFLTRALRVIKAKTMIWLPDTSCKGCQSDKNVCFFSPRFLLYFIPMLYFCKYIIWRIFLSYDAIKGKTHVNMSLYFGSRNVTNVYQYTENARPRSCISYEWKRTNVGAEYYNRPNWFSIGFFVIKPR